jgi:hypothetical protein
VRKPLGMSFNCTNGADGYCVIVTKVKPGGGADACGRISVGMVLLSLNGVTLPTGSTCSFCVYVRAASHRQPVLCMHCLLFQLCTPPHYNDKALQMQSVTPSFYTDAPLTTHSAIPEPHTGRSRRPVKCDR